MQNQIYLLEKGHFLGEEKSMNYFSLGELVMDLAPEAERKKLRNSEGAFLRLENGCSSFGFVPDYV